MKEILNKIAEKFQKAYDYIDGIRTPKWLRDLLGEIQKILVDSLFELGSITVLRIEGKIVEVSKLSVSNQEKFRRVYEFCRSEGISYKEHILTTIINNLYTKLKVSGTVK